MALAALLAAALLAATPAGVALAQDGRRHTNDVVSSITSSIGSLQLSSLPEALEVDSDRFEYDYESGQLRCAGNVRVRQGDIRMQADELKVTTIAAGKMSFRRITAEGSVSVTNGRQTARGDVAVYDQGTASITLSGGAYLGSEDSRTLTGEKVVFQLDQGRAQVESGSEPVRARIETGSLDPGAGYDEEETEGFDDFEEEETE